MDHMHLHQCLPLPRKCSPDGASPDWGCGHLITAYYSFVYPERMKGWVGLVCCLLNVYAIHVTKKLRKIYFSYRWIRISTVNTRKPEQSTLNVGAEDSRKVSIVHSPRHDGQPSMAAMVSHMATMPLHISSNDDWISRLSITKSLPRSSATKAYSTPTTDFT